MSGSIHGIFYKLRPPRDLSESLFQLPGHLKGDFLSACWWDLYCARRIIIFFSSIPSAACLMLEKSIECYIPGIPAMPDIRDFC